LVRAFDFHLTPVTTVRFSDYSGLHHDSLVITIFIFVVADLASSPADDCNTFQFVRGLIGGLFVNADEMLVITVN
jgi:hypothetical protein